MFLCVAIQIMISVYVYIYNMCVCLCAFKLLTLIGEYWGEKTSEHIRTSSETILKNCSISFGIYPTRSQGRSHTSDASIAIAASPF